MSWQKIKNALEKISRRFLDLLFPIECLGCGEEKEWLCSKCQAKIKFKTIDQCVVCKETTSLGKTHQTCQEKTKLDGVLIAAEWEDKTLQEIIHKYKYSFVTGLAEPLSKILIKKIDPLKRVLWTDELKQTQLTEQQKIILVPIPLHPRRLRWRGFNQAELLAKNIALHFDWPVDSSIILRQKHTKPQAKLKKEVREQNLHEAFVMKEIQKPKIKDKTVILIDDVLTTGTTMNECAKILKEAGAREIWGVALARG